MLVALIDDEEEHKVGVKSLCRVSCRQLRSRFFPLRGKRLIERLCRFILVDEFHPMHSLVQRNMKFPVHAVHQPRRAAPGEPAAGTVDQRDNRDTFRLPLRLFRARFSSGRRCLRQRRECRSSASKKKRAGDCGAYVPFHFNLSLSSLIFIITYPSILCGFFFHYIAK